MSMSSQAQIKKLKNRALEREEQISKGIQKVFEDKKTNMIKTIIETLESSKYKLYKTIRKD